MEEFFCLILRIAGQIHPEFAECVRVGLRQYHGRMRLATAQFRKIFDRLSGYGVCRRRDRKRDQYFIDMKSRIVVAEYFDLEFVKRFDDYRREDIHFIADPSEDFQRVDDRRRGSAE